MKKDAIKMLALPLPAQKTQGLLEKISGETLESKLKSLMLTLTLTLLKIDQSQETTTLKIRLGLTLIATLTQ